jgi:hypothetical protein
MLVEVLAVLLILMVVLTALLNPLDNAASLAPRGIEYTHAVQDATVGLARMTREVREAYTVLGTDPNWIDFQATLNGVDQHIFYECDIAYPSTPSNPYASSYRRCLRVSAPVGSALPAIATGQVIVDRLVNGTSADPVFTYTPDAIYPKYIEAQIKVPSRGELTAANNHTITLDNGFYLRNYDVGG